MGGSVSLLENVGQCRSLPTRERESDQILVSLP